MNTISRLEIKLLPGAAAADKKLACDQFEQWVLECGDKIEGVWLTDDPRPPGTGYAETESAWTIVDPDNPQVTLPSWEGWHATLAAFSDRASSLRFDVIISNRLLAEPLRIYYSQGKAQICNSLDEKFNSKALI